MTEVKAEKKEEARSEKKIVVLNQSVRSFSTSAGTLEAGQSKELPENEANTLLDYHGVIDASKLVKAATGVDVIAENSHLKIENVNLKAENTKLKSMVKKLEEDVAELEEKLEKSLEKPKGKK